MRVLFFIDGHEHHTHYPTQPIEFIVSLTRLTDGVSYFGEVTASFESAAERANEAYGEVARINILYPKEHGWRVAWVDYVVDRLEREAAENDDDQ